MKKLIPVVLVFAVSLTSCKKHLFNSIKGKGEIVTETRNLSGFNQISLSIDADIKYVQDSIYYVEISAQQNVLHVITTKIDDGELEIDSRKWIRKHNGITIIIHSPDLREIDLSGSGSFESNGMLTTPELELEISGSGSIKLAGVHATGLEADISGSGDISISGGAVTNQKVTVSGSGDMELVNLAATHSDAKISGSGSIALWASDQLKAKISGSGDIRYKGNPVVNTTISGSGSVIPI